MKAATRLAILEGAYICNVAYPREYEYLLEAGNAEKVDAWLGEIDMQLTRIGPEGAFVMTPRNVTPAETTRIKEDFARFRDVYGPAVRMLQMIRTGRDDFRLTPGEFLQLAELNQAVNESATIESQLRAMQSVIRDGSARLKNSELLKRMLDHLTRDGYLVVVNANTEVYQTTGKIAQLSAVLTFLAENSDIAGTGPEDSVGESDEAGLFES